MSDAKKNNAALEKIDAALALEPESADMWMEKGRILNRLGKYYESDACFDRALEIDPNIPIEATDRFPLNMIIKNFIIIYFIVGFSVLGIYFYFKEIRH
ncbi:MAG: hypothetical protein LUQ31_01265 [Methanoregula sp.]|nr:hypothetical protein [Methanoregula sp.]